MLPNNTTFDVYRGYAPAAPYNPPQRPAALRGLQGALRQHVRNGRFGYYPPWAKSPFYWTTVLDVLPGTDARDAYSAQLNTDAIQNGDTVMVYDYPLPGTCCAFVVSFVQRRNRGLSGDVFRLYLDRAQPAWSQNCPDPTAAGGGGGGSVNTSCCSVPVPATLYVTLSGLACLAGTYTVVWNGNNKRWECWTEALCGAGSVGVFLTCEQAPPPLSLGWVVGIECDGVLSPSGIPVGGICSPFRVNVPAWDVSCGTSSGSVSATVIS